jgi:hypothetical protein
MTEPKELIAAVPNGSTLVEYYHGSTWNDGGAWHTAIYKLPDGTLCRVKMESDYRPNDLIVEQVREVIQTFTVYEAVK